MQRKEFWTACSKFDVRITNNAFSFRHITASANSTGSAYCVLVCIVCRRKNKTPVYWLCIQIFGVFSSVDASLWNTDADMQIAITKPCGIVTFPWVCAQTWRHPGPKITRLLSVESAPALEFCVCRMSTEIPCLCNKHRTIIYSKYACAEAGIPHLPIK